jgi:hypothetical protein
VDSSRDYWCNFARRRITPIGTDPSFRLWCPPRKSFKDIIIKITCGLPARAVVIRSCIKTASNAVFLCIFQILSVHSCHKPFQTFRASTQGCAWQASFPLRLHFCSLLYSILFILQRRLSQSPVQHLQRLRLRCVPQCLPQFNGTTQEGKR